MHEPHFFPTLLLKAPPNELAWHDLRVLSDRDPDLALRRWEEVKQAARDERRSGHRGAASRAGTRAGSGRSTSPCTAS